MQRLLGDSLPYPRPPIASATGADIELFIAASGIRRAATPSRTVRATGSPAASPRSTRKILPRVHCHAGTAGKVQTGVSPLLRSAFFWFGKRKESAGENLAIGLVPKDRSDGISVDEVRWYLRLSRKKANRRDL